MDKVFFGDKKEENAVYKITLNRAQEIKEKYLDVIMQMGNFSEEEKKKINLPTPPLEANSLL